MRLTLLGSGDARQVPVYNCHCRACEQARQRPALRRGPCCALLEHDGQRWLIDSGLPDLAERFPGDTLSAVLQTHYHADHAQGLLHLRWGVNTRLPVYGPDDAEGLADLYKHPGILDFSHPFAPFEQRQFGDLAITALPLNHSRLTFGYLFETPERTLAYLTDTLGLPERTWQHLHARQLDLLVLDCTFEPKDSPPRNHNDLSVAIDIVQSLKVSRTVLTHISHTFDCWLMDNANTLPDSVSIARDGIIL